MLKRGSEKMYFHNEKRNTDIYDDELEREFENED